jgi:hypothetical protein
MYAGNFFCGFSPYTFLSMFWGETNQPRGSIQLISISHIEKLGLIMRNHRPITLPKEHHSKNTGDRPMQQKICGLLQFQISGRSKICE